MQDYLEASKQACMQDYLEASKQARLLRSKQASNII
jgi:hypothetical protein